MEHSFGSFLKQKRQEKNMTQKELSSLLFVSESAVSKWEKNVSHPDITLLPKLSEILGVTEHELITASVDNKVREEKKQAKKWRILSFTWSLFFYIAYAVALIPCFICNLAINKTLSWFFIVLSALLLSFTFTNLPKLIKKNRLVLLPLSQYLALCILLLVCCIYTGGDWFFIPAISVLLGLIIIFVPIYISKLSVFSKIEKYNDFMSVAIDFVVLNVLLIVINIYTVQGFGWWYFKVALPIVSYLYLAINVLLCVRFFKFNKLIKTSIILFLTTAFVYVPPMLIKVENPEIQKELDDANILLANLSNWEVNGCLENNVQLIVALSVILISALFLVAGILYKKINKERK